MHSLQLVLFVSVPPSSGQALWPVVQTHFHFCLHVQASVLITVTELSVVI